MYKFKKLVLATGIFFLLPFFVSAQTASLSELQAMIQSIMQQLQVLQSQQSTGSAVSNTTTSQTPSVPAGRPAKNCGAFTETLRIGSSGNEVARLQAILREEGFSIDQEESSKNYFEESTASAVTGLQEKYKSEILTPAGLKYGTGILGAGSRAKLNKIYLPCSGTSPAPTPTPTPNPESKTLLINPESVTFTVGGRSLLTAAVKNSCTSVPGTVCTALYSSNVKAEWRVLDTSVAKLVYATPRCVVGYPCPEPTTEVIGISPGKTLIEAVYINPATGEKLKGSISVTVNGPTSSDMQITTSSTLPNGKVSSGMTNILTVSGGPAGVSTNTYEWTIVSGLLPSGVYLSASDYGMIITGTPTVAGTYNFTLKARYASQSATKQFTLTIGNSTEPGSHLQIITSSTLPNGKVGEYYPNFANTMLIEGSGGLHTYNFSIINGSLPPGIFENRVCLGADPCKTPTWISGTPTTAGTYSFTYKLTSGSESVSKKFTLVVDPTIIVNPPVSTTTNASDSDNSPNYLVTGLGLNITPQTNPDLFVAGITKGQYDGSNRNIVIGANGVVTETSDSHSTYYDNCQNTQQLNEGYVKSSTVIGAHGIPAPLGYICRDGAFVIQYSPLSITSNFALGTIRAGETYSTTILATGGESYNWSLSSGSLPPGLRLNFAACRGGVCQTPLNISGTPTTPGFYNFTIMVQSGSQTAVRLFNVTVSGDTPPRDTPASATQGYLDAANCDIVGGWTLDGDNPNTGISIELWSQVDNLYWKKIGNYIANLNRADVGNHAFSFFTPNSLKDGKNHYVYVYAQNGRGEYTKLTGSGIKVTCGSVAKTNTSNLNQMANSLEAIKALFNSLFR